MDEDPDRQLLLGATISQLERHGKQLAILAQDGRVLCIHLGMSGRIRLITPGEDEISLEPHTHWLKIPAMEIGIPQ